MSAAKLDRLIQLQERTATQDAKKAFLKALSSMQAKLPVIPERGSITHPKGGKSTSYALWEDINEAIKPILSKYGFTLTFRTHQEKSQIIVTGILSHKLGHSEESVMRLPVDTSGSKNPVQAVGSSTSYGKRYSAAALLNLTSRGDDDDGDDATKTPCISEEQKHQLQARLDEMQADESRLCRFLKVTRLDDIALRDFDRALQVLDAKERAS
ncbi:ERF family protein [Methyloligella solikamskensis]|uniref:ERF family protein n=1 Tax=Methyloligella solikamskensis TaxID=1177756 RepID=A0ABW3JBE4_9HYPH